MRSESSEHALETRELLGTFEEMTLIDLAEFVRAFEEKFDVTAAAPAAVVGAAGLGASAAESAEEEDEFDVIITGAGDKKIQVIKVVRELTSLGLKEAKDLVDSASQAVLERARKDIADKAAAALESAGAAVDVRRSAPV
ncbi:50S ribosomal protein L7/L12 [Streptomyces sp. NBC_01537]|uniref:50S ribosomal protein L7/L12 n=1 Tax=Streptomyces sp. NBC_01537 TaxID=2903896 RepID=UPI0038646086